MEFPDTVTVEDALDAVEFPRFARVRYDPPTSTCGDVERSTREAVDALPLADLPAGATVAVCLGSRGIEDVATIASTVVATLDQRGFDPVAVPAMGSHGGATAEGQRRTLAALGVTEASLGCPIDDRMDATRVGESAVGADVYAADAAREADAILPVNRVKPHTNFRGSVESGLCKMLAVGLGKRRGARSFHERALVDGYEATIRAAVDLLRDELPVVGGVAVVENARDETALVEGVPADALLEREPDLLARARDYMPTLPYDDLDVLVVDEIGKDVSGTGMDTNVVGRYGVLNAADPDTPDIARIVVRGLTEATHGNGHGIGLADLTTRDAVEGLDLGQMYTNALTSNSLSRAALPVVLPTDEHALTAAVTTAGPYDPETVRAAWIRDTGHLSTFRVSPALAAGPPDHVTVEGYDRLAFDDGRATFRPVDLGEM